MSTSSKMWTVLAISGAVLLVAGVRLSQESRAEPPVPSVLAASHVGSLSMPKSPNDRVDVQQDKAGIADNPISNKAVDSHTLPHLPRSQPQQVQGGTVRWVDEMNTLAMGPKGRSAYSEVVAEVTVGEILNPAFNTAGGAPPTATMSPDPAVDDSGWNLWRVVVLDVVQIYAGGASVNKIVTAVRGGAYYHAPSNTTYEHAVIDPDSKDLNAVGTTAMIFGYKVLGDSAPPSPEPWQSAAWTKISQLQQQGYTVIYSSAEAAYIYSGANASSGVDNTTLSITQLRNVAANPPPW